MIVNAPGITIVPMKIEEDGMTGIQMTDGNETIEVEDAREMSKVATDAKMKTTPEMTGIVENVVTQISHSERSAIAVVLQRDEAAEAHQNSGLVPIEELVIGKMLRNLVLEIGNVAIARK